MQADRGGMSRLCLYLIKNKRLTAIGMEYCVVSKDNLA